MNWLNKVPLRAKVILLAGFIIGLILITCSGCSMRSYYPIGGAIAGGTVGAALAGPGGAAVGAGVGSALGEIAEGDGELKDARATITALTTGDVNALMQKQMDDGFFDGILDGIYDLLMISAIIVGLWILIPLWYTRWVHNKHKEAIKK